MIKPWPKKSSKNHGDFRIFTVRSDNKISPRTNTAHDFVVIETVNWVNVVALTSDDQMVMVEQFRHGSETVELEIPGGVMDPHETSPVATAIRELREETGYEGTGATLIGQVYPNPAIMNNTCYTVLIENCRAIHPVEFDSTEDMITTLLPLKQIPELVAAGKIRHSLVVTALYFYDLWQKR